jgi:type VI secretion system protein ImpJ
MSSGRKVVWYDGIYLKPQHLQQQERYLERYADLRSRSLIPHSWGFTHAVLDPGLLTIGKLGLLKAEGVFQDGTPFRMPEDDPLPEAIDIPTTVRDQTVYLAIAVQRPGGRDIVRGGLADPLARHDPGEAEVFDNTAPGPAGVAVEVGALRTTLRLATEMSGVYSGVPLAHVVECRSDQRVVVDDGFMPTVLQIPAATKLMSLVRELLGLLHQRGEAIAARIATTGRGGSAEHVNLLMLQAINRYEAMMTHVARTAIHPEQLYRLWVEAAGDLATFTANSRRPRPLPPYQHERLRESFVPVFQALEEALNTIFRENAVPIPLEERKFGFWLGRVHDRTLLETAIFVLAVKADLTADEVQRRVATQLKIGPPERIEDIVTRALRGVPAPPTQGAPRQVPIHAGFVYFEIDRSHELWKEVRVAGAIALFPGEFPGLSVEMWAIRVSA